jgi:GDPmannose 4,6-dehydratase
MYGKANPSKAEERLGWAAIYKMKDVVKMMVEAEQRLIIKQ